MIYLENNNIREKEAAALRNWFSSQKRFGSWAAMERALKITKDYLHLVKNGKRRAVDPELRNKLYEATGLDTFKPIVSLKSSKRDFQKKRAETNASAKSDPEITIKKTPHPIYGKQENATTKANEIKKLIIDLADALEFFKNKPESARKTFRRTIPGEDVGYITTFLKALYDEDQFQRWLFFSEYKLRSKEES
jgi:hypothetical protein